MKTMRLWTTLLLSFAVCIPVAVIACNDDPAVEPGSSTGNPPADDDDDDNSSGSTSGKTTSSSGAPANPNVVTQSMTMEFNGSTRTYLLAKPTKYDEAKKYPLVLNFHGNPGTPTGESVAMPFDSVTKQDAIVVYPQAASQDNADFNWDFSPPDENPDMQWIQPLIEEVATKVSIDKDRVLAFGYSGGAYFLSQYACRVDVKGFIKLVGIVSGGAPEPRPGDDQRPNECVKCVGAGTPMFIAHGETDDSEVPFVGGDYARQCWAADNGCNDDDFQGGTAPCKNYNGCTAPVTWCPVPDQGHGPWQPAMQQAWDMLKALP